LKIKINKSNYKDHVEKPYFKLKVENIVSNNKNGEIKQDIINKIYDFVPAIFNSDANIAYNSAIIWKALNYLGYDVPPEYFNIKLNKDIEYKNINEMVELLMKNKDAIDYILKLFDVDDKLKYKMAMFKKYLKYKTKYLELKKRMKGGVNGVDGVNGVGGVDGVNNVNTWEAMYRGVPSSDTSPTVPNFFNYNYNTNAMLRQEEEVDNIKKLQDLIAFYEIKIFEFVRELNCDSIDINSTDTITTVCKFNESYPFANNDKESLIKKNQLLINKISEGFFGSVYDSIDFNNNNMIVKVPKIIRTDTINEMFVNFVIINKLLILNPTLGLVPSYGIIKCNLDKPTDKCNLDNNGPLTYFLVMKKIKGITLLELLKEKKITTVKEIRNGIKQILNLLIILQESEYHLEHGDLNTRNIIIDENFKWFIIDYGFSTFTIIDGGINKNVISSFFIQKYTGNSNTYMALPLMDILTLLIDIHNNTNIVEIKCYLNQLIQHIFSVINKELGFNIDVNMIYNNFTNILDFLSERYPYSQPQIVKFFGADKPYSKYKSIRDIFFSAFA
jgi:hypothetical protein